MKLNKSEKAQKVWTHNYDPIILLGKLIQEVAVYYY